jgi:hypothetical protein
MPRNTELNDLRAIFAGIDIEIPPDPLDTLTEALGLREVTTEELAAVLGVTDRRISQLWIDGHIPEPRKEGKRHFYPLLRSVAGYIRFLKQY